VSEKVRLLHGNERMRADEPLADAVREAMGAHARTLRKRLRRARQGDADAVHDARTTLRRLREGLVVMQRPGFDPASVGRFEVRLHQIERALGPTRDDDVLLADLDEWLTRAARHQRNELAAMRDLICRRRKRHANALAHELRRRRFRRAVRDLRRWLTSPAPPAEVNPPNPSKAAPNLVRHFTPDLTWRAYEEIVAYEARSHADFDVIHQVRSSCRRLRYLLEMFDGALPEGAEDIVDSLRALQDRLGSLHDDVVAVARLERWRAHGKVRQGEAFDAYVAHRRASRDRRRREFEGQWRALTGDTFRFTLSHVVSGEIGHDRPDGAVRLTR
jgi:CHAD domain-containing protein